MNFTFEIDFDSEEVAIYMDDEFIGIVYRMEGKFYSDQFNPSFEEHRNELFSIGKALFLVAENV